MPSAKRTDWQQLATGACDNNYVEVQGVVRSVGAVHPPAWQWDATALRLDIGANFVWAYLRGGQALPAAPLVDGTVRVRGVCLVFANSQRQFQASVLTVARGADVEVIQPGPGDPFTAPLQPIHQLLGYSPGSLSFHRVKVEGVATLQLPGGVYVQQGSEAVLVRTPSAPKTEPGDRVEAVGFPVAGGFSTVLEDGLVRVMGHGPGIAPHEIPAEKMLARVSQSPAVPNGVLVRVAGHALNHAASGHEEIITLADGGTTFNARLRGGSGSFGDVALGERIAVTGVCEAHLDDHGLPESFDLLMRSPADLQVLQPPPRFSRAAVLNAAEALLGFLAVALVGLGLLRRRVRRQTETIRLQLEREIALQQRYTDLVENASDLVYVRDLEGRLLQVNRGAEELTGYSREELLQMNVLDLLAPSERARAREGFGAEAASDHETTSEWRFRTKDGRERVIETKQRFLMEGGKPALVESIGRDVTARQIERNRLEEELHHAQKLESVGRLAGGVAHDFNNLLTVISGYAQMALEATPAEGPMREAIDEISRAADRAGALTRQLLLFSRRTKASPRTLSLNELVRNLEKMLGRLIGEHIKLTLAFDATADLIDADPGHIEQVVMNLAVNARDAMPDGGSLLIATGDFQADREYAGRHLGVAEGRYVALRVVDTGVGMGADVRSRMFEPFFTTKEQGKGTGLGLSTVYGIVKQCGGAIEVDSEPGRGTEFEILFPAARPSSAERSESTAGTEDFSGAETILLAEDEDGVRAFISQALRSHGYRVIEAVNGRDALEKAAAYGGPIHLLVSDVVMPEMGGLTLADRFAQVRPGTPALHMSGYADRELIAGVANLIGKPFTPGVLLQRVRETLNGRKRVSEVGGRP